ncbi:LRRC48 family protein [Megaselia abdita]
MVEKYNPLQQVVYPDLEPGVINRDMINEALESLHFKGEKGRLQKLDNLNYTKVTILRLELKNILRIDHLWFLENLTTLSLNFNRIEKIENIEMLTNLKKLDLSFNYIQKIENLDKLVLIETLSLYNNLITDIENLDELENLKILSIGNNNIGEVKGIERFRFLKKLYALNLEGNPIAENSEKPLRVYIAAVLPNLKYYNYTYLKDEEREKGQEQFARELREIYTAEEDEIEYRAKKAKAKEDEERLSSSFVEWLNEHQLFESLWEGDEDGDALCQIGEEADELVKEYKNDTFALTQEIYKIGLLRYEERQKEVELFEKSLKSGKAIIQVAGQKLVNIFLEHKIGVFRKAAALYRNIERASLVEGKDQFNSHEVKEWVENVDTLFNNFEEKGNDLWRVLVEQELHLAESVEEATTNFRRNLQEMVSRFIEQSQTYFVQLRDVAMNFCENLQEAVTQFIALVLATGNLDVVPEGLKECTEDKDAIMNIVAGMRDHQLQRIDAREDRLVTRARDWCEQLLDEITQKEMNRNRSKIVEINFFLEQMKESFYVVQLEARDEIIQETLNS